MARILWLTSQVPDRQQGGGNIRQAHLLTAAAAEHEVHLAVVGHLSDAGLRGSLAEVIELPLPPARPPARGLRRRAEHVRSFVRQQPQDCVSQAVALAALRSVAIREGEYEVVCVQHLALVPLLTERRRARWTADLHNLVSIQAAQIRNVSTGVAERLFWAREAARARRLEQWTVASCDRTFVCSEADAVHLGPVHVIPNGVDVDGSSSLALSPGLPEPVDSSDPANAARVVFIGSLDYRPNIDGVRWLCDEVMPLVHAQRSNAVLQIIGHRPTAEVIHLSRRADIEVHADVDSVEPFLRGARVAVVPLRIGSGTRLKALEAMAARRPIVGTTIGLSGLGLVDGVHARIVDDASGFASGIVELLERNDIAQAFTDAARRLAEERFSWSSIGREHSAHLASLAATPART